MAEKKILRMVIISLSQRLGRVIQQGLARFEVEVRTHTRIDQGLKEILAWKPHVALIEDQLRNAYNGAAAINQRAPRTGVILISRGMTRSKVLLAAQAGVSRIVVRPFALITLLDQIRGACNMAGNEGGQLVPTSEEVIDLLREAPDGQAVLIQLQRIETLKAVPHVVERVLAITNDESSGAGEMEQVVRGDPNIAAVVLKRANSTYYSAVQKITRVRDAVTRIGFNDVRNIVLALSVMNLHGRESNQVSFDREEFWKASLGTAILAREFAAHLGLPTTEEAFLIGLLADFGCMVLDEYLPDKLEQSICLAHKEMIPLKEAEKRVLGITHAQIGGFVLDRWGFPERVINVISGQHSAQSTRSLSVPDRMLATAVWLGRWSVQGLGIGDKSESVYNYAPPTLLQGLEISSLLTNEFLTDTVEEISSMLEFFKVKVTWPYVFEEDSPEIYIHEVNPPVISPLELTVRRVSSTPVRISKIAKLDELPANSVAIIALGRADTLKEACEGKNWGERPWLFVLPRGQIPKDNSLKERDGLPVGRCDYAEFPFVMTELTCAISRLQASNLQQQEED